jgi:flagellar operon protein
MVDPIRFNPAQPVKPAQGQNNPQPKSINTAGPNFADTLANVQNLRFSNHAQKRMQYRDINLSDDGISRLANAVEKADKRGGKESLVLVDDLAFIVNIKDRLVVTALDPGSRGEGVFTKIDSVVFADPAQAEESADNTNVES